LRKYWVLERIRCFCILCPYVQRELVPMQAETQRRIQEMEKELKEFPQAAQLHKVKETPHQWQYE
jgi:hypothetical protein